MQYFYIKNIIIFIDKNYHSWYIITMVFIKKSIDKTRPVYISGPVTSLIKLGLDWKQPFIEAEEALRRLGFNQVYNPVNVAEEVDARFEAKGMKATYADYMRADVKLLLKSSMIVMLRGWENSKGARLEYELAEAMGMEVIYER